MGNSIAVGFLPRGAVVPDLTASAASPRNITGSATNGTLSLVVLAYSGGTPLIHLEAFGGTNGIPIGAYSHVILVFNTVGTLTYLNGTFRPHSKTAAGPGAAGASGTLPRVAREAHYIGRGQQGESGLADGYISDFRVYSGGLRAGYETLLLTAYDGTELVHRMALFLGNDSIPADGSWHHVALVLTLDAYHTYLDGVLRPNARASSLTPGSGAIPKRNRTTHFIGAGWSVGPYPFGVDLADFRVYSAALSKAQVADAMQGLVARDRPPLEVHYKFDTCGGSVRPDCDVPARRRGPALLTRGLQAVDYSGKGRPGTMYGDLEQATSLQCPVPSSGAHLARHALRRLL
eukprot:tig00000241_g21039.t1